MVHNAMDEIDKFPIEFDNELWLQDARDFMGCDYCFHQLESYQDTMCLDKINSDVNDFLFFHIDCLIEYILEDNPEINYKTIIFGLCCKDEDQHYVEPFIFDNSPETEEKKIEDFIKRIQKGT